MENLANFEKIKDNLLNELDSIIDDKRSLFDQIKNVEKEEVLIKNNIIFFENYLKLLENDNKFNERSVELDLNEFMKIIPKENEMNNGNIYQGSRQRKYSSGLKKKDLIEENIKAFDEAHNFVYEQQNVEVNKSGKSKKSRVKETKADRNEKEGEEPNNNKETKVEYPEDINKKTFDDNYFVNLIKRNFES